MSIFLSSMFCIASASGNSFFSKDQENVKTFLNATTDSSGGSGIGVRSIEVCMCTEKNFTVNGDGAGLFIKLNYVQKLQILWKVSL